MRSGARRHSDQGRTTVVAADRAIRIIPVPAPTHPQLVIADTEGLRRRRQGAVAGANVPVMQEFSSISVSSYEAGSLADQLTEQARNGWDVVAIVPTGSTVTAYLSRAASDDAEQSDHTPAEVPAAEPAPTSTSDAAATWSVLAEEAAAEPEAAEPEPITVPEIVVPEVTLPEVSQSEVSVPEATIAEPAQPTIEPVDEPAGWAVAPESASSADTVATTADPAAGLGSYGASSSYDSGASIAAAADEVAAEPQQQAAAVETQQAVAAASAAPAGWYADPSSRYELRYWDGAQWTEHVSRGGQQFTDPPVA
jgi:hypothetical protein